MKVGWFKEKRGNGFPLLVNPAVENLSLLLLLLICSPVVCAGLPLKFP